MTITVHSKRYRIYNKYAKSVHGTDITVKCHLTQIILLNCLLSSSPGFKQFHFLRIPMLRV